MDSEHSAVELRMKRVPVFALADRTEAASGVGC